MDSIPPQRVQTRGAGVGEVSRAQIEDRAAELAKMEGRLEVNEGDRARATEELQGPVGDTGAPEAVTPGLEEVVSWDEPLDASGQRADRVLPEDEANIAEQLVQEGVEEAEHDRRVVASEDQPLTDAQEEES